MHCIFVIKLIMVKIKIILITVFLVLTHFSCTKDKNGNQDANNTIPQVQVDLYLNLNEPANFELSTIGGWRYALGGSKGIILYRGQDKYYAYDRHTPLNSAKNCAIVSVDSTSFFAVDSCSGSRFFLADGSVVDGVATMPLVQYETSVISDVLRVTN
ncbi:MAG: hypothetical protein ACKVJP_02225 [Flavobacteriales bacterium]